jgi:hypothetical protein
VAIRDALKDDKSLSDEDRTQAIDGIQELIDAQTDGEDEAPKAPESADDSSA